MGEEFFFFFNFWLRWVFVAARRLSLVAASGGHSSLWRAGFSLRWPLPLQSTGSRRRGLSSCGSQVPERRLSSCGAPAQLLCSMWDPPGPGLEPASPALAGGFLLTYLFIYLFIFGCVGSSFLCEGFLQLRRAGATLNRGARASHCCSLSRCGAQAPDAQAQ